MLTKVTKDNYQLGTGQIIKYINTNKNTNFLQIQDNLLGNLLIKENNNTYVYNYYNNKIYKHNKIQIIINDIKIVKQIDSFDQNNLIIANKVRKYIIKLVNNITNNITNNIINNITTNKLDTILGIGGEYYVYFPFINSKNYIGISNHKTIIDDALYNVPFSKNYLTDYNNIKTYPSIKKVDLIILNVFNIHINIINFLKSIDFKKLIIISCSLSDNKLLLINNNFIIKKIKYFQNYNGYIRIIEINPKI